MARRSPEQIAALIGTLVDCVSCGVSKPLDDYYSRSDRDGSPHQPCKECHKARCKTRHDMLKTDKGYLKLRKASRAKYESANRSLINTRRNIKRFKTRQQLIEMYGESCACCGEAICEFLAIDHTNGGGKKHIASFKSFSAYQRWLLKEKRQGFRVLCHNCNLARGFYGYCPHEATQ